MWIVGAWLELPVWLLLLALAGCYATTAIFIHLLAFHSPARPHVRLSAGRPVSQYAGNEGCAG